MSMRVKLADFGLAYQDIFEGRESQFNIRWAAPEIWRKLIDDSYDDSTDDTDGEDFAEEEEADREATPRDSSRHSGGSRSTRSGRKCLTFYNL